MNILREEEEEEEEEEGEEEEEEGEEEGEEEEEEEEEELVFFPKKGDQDGRSPCKVTGLRPRGPGAQARRGARRHGGS